MVDLFYKKVLHKKIVFAQKTSFLQNFIRIQNINIYCIDINIIQEIKKIEHKKMFDKIQGLGHCHRLFDHKNIKFTISCIPQHFYFISTKFINSIPINIIKTYIPHEKTCMKCIEIIFIRVVIYIQIYTFTLKHYKFS